MSTPDYNHSIFTLSDVWSYTVCTFSRRTFCVTNTTLDGNVWSINRAFRPPSLVAWIDDVITRDVKRHKQSTPGSRLPVRDFNVPVDKGPYFETLKFASPPTRTCHAVSTSSTPEPCLYPNGYTMYVNTQMAIQLRFSLFIFYLRSNFILLGATIEKTRWSSDRAIRRTVFNII